MFVYLGFSTFNYYSTHWCPGFIAYMILITLAARVVHLYFLSGMVKLCIGEKFPFTAKGLSVIWLGGAIRGAVAFALILSASGSHSKVLITTTLGIVIFSTIAFGAVMPLWYWLMREERMPDKSYKIDFQTSMDVSNMLVTHPNHAFRVSRNETAKDRSWLH